MKRFQVNRLSSLRRLWPRQCLACSADTGNAYLCTACRAALLPAGPQCQRCLEPPPPASGRAGPSPAPGECCAPLPPPWETAWVPWRYAWPLDRLVLGAKFGGRLAWARALGELLADHLPEEKRGPIWADAATAVSQAFNQFSVEGISVRAMKGQQPRFRQQVESALRDLLADCLAAFSPDELVDVMMDYVQREVEGWRERIGEEEFQNFLRLLLLQAIDLEWREYLTAMDDLRREIGLQAIAQRDPKIEYKRRSFEMFSDMRHNIDKNIVKDFFMQVIRHDDFVRRQLATVNYRERQSQEYQMVKRSDGRGVENRRDMPKVGRNDPCPCGSGKKYKQCHMRQDQRVVKQR
jgi:uncharacterized protein YecA (UPF0149 family)